MGSDIKISQIPNQMAAVDTSAIARLFHPANVVLVGASERPGHWSGRVFDNLRRFGFAGRVLPVNPGRREIWGAPCYPSLDQLPEPPDHLAIFTPAEVTLRILREGGAAGARSATVYAAGFGEGGHADGIRLGEKLRCVLDDTGLTVAGPTCMGVACGTARFATIPDETLQALAPSAVAVVVQSGAMCAAINRAINELGLKVAYLASCGSQIGCKVSDFIDYYAGEDELRVILCYIEAVPDAAHFLDAARRARNSGKVVVAVKIGGSDAARASALAHTGALAGSAEVFEAFAAAAGIVRFNSLDDAIEAVEFLARAPLPRGGNIAVMTNSGAQSSLVVEAAARTGAKLPALSAVTAHQLAVTLDQPDVANPLDTRRTIATAQYLACLDALLDDDGVDIVLVSEELPMAAGVARRVANLRALAGAVQRASGLGKSLAMFTPLLLSATEYGRSVRAELAEVPILRETERSLRVMRALGSAATRPLHVGEFFASPADTEVARAWRARAAALAGPTALNEVESKALLLAYGIAAPPERLVKTVGEAEAAADEIGFPVVLKGVSATMTHKSDAGLVIMDIADGLSVRQAAAAIALRARAQSAQLDGLLVAQHMSGGTETVLGVTRDVEMGATLMFGLGGVLVELFRDVTFAPATLDRERARAMVQSTRASRLLAGFRGAPPGDVDALCDALLALGRLACDIGDIVEAIDINPFLVGARGEGGYALDALVVLRPPPRD
jgi:acyl-CoA synthetase (NDP forming)